MKTKSCLIVVTALLLNINVSTFAQVVGEQGTVKYLYTIASVGLQEEYQLKFNKDASVYQHHQEGKSMISPQGYEIFSPRKFYDWYLESKTRQVTEQQVTKEGKTVFATFDANMIDWEIQNETKTILGYSVQKAIAKKHHFLSPLNTQDYGDAIAWFAVKLPCISGPERFWGLPGLILEVSFARFKGVYTAAQISFEPVSNLKPDKGTEISKEQLYEGKPWLFQARELLNKDN